MAGEEIEDGEWEEVRQDTQPSRGKLRDDRVASPPTGKFDGLLGWLKLLLFFVGLLASLVLIVAFALGGLPRAQCAAERWGSLVTNYTPTCDLPERRA